MSCDALIAATMAIAASVGKIAAQDEMGTKVVHVRDTGRSMAEGARYHETNASGGLHTDGPQLSKPPDLLFTACFRRAKYGGDSLLASAATLHNRLMQEGRDMLAVLHDSFHFDRRGFGNLHNPTLERPIFICSRSHFSFRYLYEYILDGHSKAKVPLSNLQRDAIETLRGMLEEDDVVLRVRVNPGELLITNNHRVCHGRTSFQDDSAQGTVRHLIRVWANV
jgi:alpha-ketoglutarate-dependent taurine dioxygenase